MTDTREHLHLDDHPATLTLLAALLNPARRGHNTLTGIGYEPTEHGAWVDWDRLSTSWLCSTERAVVHVARGVAILERAGGPPPRLSPAVRAAIAAVTPELKLPAWMTGTEPMPEPVTGRDYVELDEAARVRDAATTRRFLVPELDGEIQQAARQLQEILKALADWRDDDPDAAIPTTLDHHAAGAAGTLSAAISAAPAHSLYGPDGRYQHEPLAVVDVAEHILDVLAAAVASLATAVALGNEAVCLVLAEHQSHDPAHLVTTARRLLAVYAIEWGCDEELIAGRLSEASVGSRRVVLTDAEEAAYNRIRDRLVRAWHDGDPLARWAY